MHQLIGLVGILSFFQLILFPGYLLLRVLRLQVNVIRLYILSFALSLTINYVVVALLTINGLYTPVIVWSLLGIEASALIYYTILDRKIAWQSYAYLNNEFSEFHRSIAQCSRPFYLNSLLTLSLIVIAFWSILFLNHLVAVFSDWDPVMSYNFWAEQWSNNHLPVYTWHYPQLLPANWSLTYVMIAPFSAQLKLQFFAKAIMPLFPIILCLALFDLAITTKNWAYLIAILFVSYLFYFSFHDYLNEGWVDIPVATLSFLVIYGLLHAKESIVDKDLTLWKYLFISAIIAGGAASTKQAGLYIVLWYPILSYILVMRHISLPGALKATRMASNWALALVICLPWYGYIQCLINHHLAVSEVNFVTKQIYIVQQWTDTFRVIWAIVEPGFGYWLTLALALYAIKIGKLGRLFAVFALPYVIIWFMFYSYSIRNIAITIPLLSCAAAFALQAMFASGKLTQIMLKFRDWFNWRPALLFIAAIMIAGVMMSAMSLFDWKREQIILQRQMGIAYLNWMLFNYKYQHGYDGKILTTWDYIGHIPGLSQYYQPYRPPSVEASPYQSAWMDDPSELKGVLMQYPAHYILVPIGYGMVSPAYLKYFDALKKQHKIKVVFEIPKFTLYEMTADASSL